MSGGAYQYEFGRVRDVADEVDRRTEAAEDPNRGPVVRRVYGSTSRRWLSAEESAPILAAVDAERRWFAAHLRLVAEAMRCVEWVDSDDYGPGDEVEAIRALRAHAAAPRVDPAREVAVDDVRKLAEWIWSDLHQHDGREARLRDAIGAQIVKGAPGQIQLLPEADQVAFLVAVLRACPGAACVAVDAAKVARPWEDSPTDMEGSEGERDRLALGRQVKPGSDWTGLVGTFSTSPGVWRADYGPCVATGDGLFASAPEAERDLDLSLEADGWVLAPAPLVSRG